MGDLSKKVLLELVVPLTKDVLAELATKATLSVWMMLIKLQSH